ncbi:MAG: MRP family ATP-binding protein, partial [Gammaproteobacteria bacterium]|nr:MRP family ATP-binding protein [Gammaproteobacteria bacterium]
QADGGLPTVVQDPDGEVAGIYRDAARHLAARIWRLDAEPEAPQIRMADD